MRAAHRQVGHTASQLGAWRLTGLLEGERSPGASSAALSSFPEPTPTWLS